MYNPSIISNICTAKRKHTDLHKNKKYMLSLDDYYRLAEKHIQTFAHYSHKHRMLNDEDIISYIATELMFATCRWSPKKKANLTSFLNTSGRLIIYTLQKKLTKYKTINSIYMSDVQYMDTTNTYNNMLQRIEHMLDDEQITDMQKYCIKEFFINNRTKADIAREVNLSRERVRQHIKNGLNTLKKINNVTS